MQIPCLLGVLPMRLLGPAAPLSHQSSLDNVFTVEVRVHTSGRFPHTAALESNAPTLNATNFMRIGITGYPPKCISKVATGCLTKGVAIVFGKCPTAWKITRIPGAAWERGRPRPHVSVTGCPHCVSPEFSNDGSLFACQKIWPHPLTNS